MLTIDGQMRIKRSGSQSVVELVMSVHFFSVSPDSYGSARRANDASSRLPVDPLGRDWQSVEQMSSPRKLTPVEYGDFLGPTS